MQIVYMSFVTGKGRREGLQEWGRQGGAALNAQRFRRPIRRGFRPSVGADTPGTQLGQALRNCWNFLLGACFKTVPPAGRALGIQYSANIGPLGRPMSAELPQTFSPDRFGVASCIARPKFSQFRQRAYLASLVQTCQILPTSAKLRRTWPADASSMEECELSEAGAAERTYRARHGDQSALRIRSLCDHSSVSGGSARRYVCKCANRVAGG